MIGSRSAPDTKKIASPSHHESSINYNTTILNTSNILDETIDKLIEYTINIAENYANNNKYDDALKEVTNGIKIVTGMSYSAEKLISLKDKYDSMMPTSLTSLNEEINGNSIKEDIAILDNNIEIIRSILDNANKDKIIFEMNIKDIDGRYPFHNVTSKNNIEKV